MFCAPLRLLALVLAVGLATATVSSAAVITHALPFPPIVDGIPVAAQYDQFVSYSLPLLDDIQDKNPFLLPESQYGDYDGLISGAGTGNLDVIIYTGAGGANNNDVLGISTLDFASPLNAPGGNVSSFTGTWGDSQTTVGRVLDYLQEFSPDSTTPVFLFDNNQTGVSAVQSVNARVRIMDGANIVGSWSLDNITNGLWDPDALVVVVDQIDIPGAATTSGTSYSASHNVGSGRTEFAAYAPSMDLSLFNRDFLFVIDVNLDELNGGFEELFMTGRIAISQPAIVPEPGTLAIWSLGVLGLIGYRRK